MTTSTIKVFSNSRNGAPIVSNNWGDLTNMLDACLINGYNSQPIKSTTGTGTAVTATLNSGHGFKIGDVVNITGATLAPPIQNTLSSTANVTSLLHFEGTNNSTVFADECGGFWTTFGADSAVISTTQSKIGSSSAYFNGSSALTCTSNNLVFGTNDLTIEFNVFFPTVGVQNVIFDTRSLGVGTSSTSITLYITSSGLLTFYSSGADRIQSTAISANTWYHVALVRQAGVFSMYINGTKLGTTYTAASGFNAQTAYLAYDAATGQTFTFYLDEMLIMNGTAKYTANFTAPTTAYGLNVYGISSTTSLGETTISNETYCLNTVTNPVISWQTLSGTTGYKVWKGAGSQLENAYFLVAAGTTTFTDTGTGGAAASIPSGVSESAYSGEYTLTSTTSSTITFPSTATVNFSGVAKFAPLGFSTVFTALNKRVYKSVDSGSSQNLLRVDNSLDPAYPTTYAKYGKVTVCDAMSDINTFTTSNRMPYNTGNANINETGTGSGATGINGWFKWIYATNQANNNVPVAPSAGDGGTFARKWYLVGNSKTFYIIIYHGIAGSTVPYFYAFGDINSYKLSDIYNTLLIAVNSPLANNVVNGGGGTIASSNNISSPMIFQTTSIINGVNAPPTLYGGGGLLKSYTGTGSWISTAYTTVLNRTSGNPSYSGFLGTFNAPSQVDFSIIINPLYCLEYSGSVEMRGVVPGIYHLLQNAVLPDGTIMNNVAGYTGKTFLFLTIDAGYTWQQIANGQLAFDITGPW